MHARVQMAPLDRHGGSDKVSGVCPMVQRQRSLLYVSSTAPPGQIITKDAPDLT